MNRQTTLLAALGVVLVIALWWVFLYSPGQEELQQLEDEIAATEEQGAALRTRIATLEEVRATAPETEALIAQLNSIVPADPALAGALRQLEASAEDAGVEVRQIGASRPAVVADAQTPGLHEVALSMSVEGSYFQLVDFLRRVEDPTITARGVVFETLSLSASEYPTLTASVSGLMYAVLDPVPDVDAEGPGDDAGDAGAEESGDTPDGGGDSEADSDGQPLPAEDGGVE